MKNILEKVILATLVVAMILAILGLALPNTTLITIALVILMAISVVFGVTQVITYLNTMGQPEEMQNLIMMIVSFVVCITIIVLSIFTFTGKLFNLY
ncbi:MAG: hypothetical protein J6R37_04705 [Clostridia bacterium]|nr:hypothetical protein [Clostridia bacterium]